MSVTNSHDAARQAQLTTPQPASAFGAFAQQAQNSNTAPMEKFTDPAWEFTDSAIDASRWNKQFPYQLLVLDAVKDGYTVNPDWHFTLPIPPESITISMPVATNLQVTQGGIVEEHNGAPVRIITFSGTTGVLPNRDLAATAGGIPAFIEKFGGIGAGTIQSVSSSAVALAQRFDAPMFNIMGDGELSDSAKLGGLGAKGRGTGYYQMRLLQQFLESYVNMKKRGGSAAKHRRLAVAIWKDQAVYICSLQNFELSKSAGDALAYRYQLSFKAWKRVKAQASAPAAVLRPRALSPPVLQRVLSGLSTARAVLAAGRSVLEAARGDASQALEVLRQGALMCKDALGLAPALADLPANIASDAKGAVVEFMSIGAAFSDARDDVNVADSRRRQNISDINNALQGSSQSKIGARSPGSASQALGNSAEPAAKLLNDPDANYETLSKIDVSKLALAPSVLRKIADETARVRALTPADFRGMGETLQQLAADFADSIGEGSASFTATYGRPTVTANKRASEEDFQVLYALNNSVLEFARLSIADPSQSSGRLNAIEYVAGLARKSGIAFRSPASKYPVPFPYNATLEQVALRYLGDANRWHEIVALNGLRSPYVDEVGFTLPLIANGYKNQLTIEGSDQLYIGQPITIVSSNTTKTKRRITKIDVVHSGTTILHVDGEADLARFVTMANASIHMYLPDTVNSSMQLYIPSDDQPVGQSLVKSSIPGVSEFTPYLEAGGIDLLLTASGDLAITPDGDCKLAIGLTNLVQRVRLAVSTPRGSLPQHPQYGLGLKAGMSTADLDAKSLVEAARGLFKDDPSFSGVIAATVQKAGPVLRLNMSIGIAGQDLALPVSVDVLR